jgi:hypothetical protein
MSTVSTQVNTQVNNNTVHRYHVLQYRVTLAPVSCTRTKYLNVCFCN